MKIISRQAAIAAGLTHYYTGTPCKYGHLDKRRLYSRDCATCASQRAASHRAKEPLRPTYNGMLQRCFNENDPNYRHYGGRGITVCDRWIDPENGYENFLSDLGPRPKGFTVDRIDCDGDYAPSNCRWADDVTQMRNRRCTKMKAEDVVAAFHLIDEGMLQKEVARLYKCTKGAIQHIIKNRERYIEAGLDCRPQEAAG